MWSHRSCCPTWRFAATTCSPDPRDRGCSTLTVESAADSHSRPARGDRRRIGEGAPRSPAARRALLSCRSRPSSASRCGEAWCAACRDSRPRGRRARGDNERRADSAREPRDAVERRPPCPCARCLTRRRGGARSPTSAWTGSTFSPRSAAHRTHSGARSLRADSRRSSPLLLRSAPSWRAAAARPPRDGALYRRCTTGAGLPLRDARGRRARARSRASLVRAAPPWLRRRR